MNSLSRLQLFTIAALLLFQSCTSFGPAIPLRSRHITINNGIAGRKKSLICMGIRVTIRIVGRKQGSEKWLEDACRMYETRLRPANIDVLTEWHKSDDALVKGVATDYNKGTPVVLMDSKGKKCTSEEFGEDFFRWVEDGGSRLTFVIGGANGLPEELKSPAIAGKQPNLLSLSNLTFTHQFARLVLIEQIYRASEIRKGSSYHK